MSQRINQVQEMEYHVDCVEVKEGTRLEEIVDLGDYSSADVVDLELEGLDKNISNERLEKLIEEFAKKQNSVGSKGQKEEIIVNPEENTVVVTEENFQESLNLAFDLLEVPT